jgi:hypothetical protein
MTLLLNSMGRTVFTTRTESEETNFMLSKIKSSTVDRRRIKKSSRKSKLIWQRMKNKLEDIPGRWGIAWMSDDEQWIPTKIGASVLSKNRNAAAGGPSFSRGETKYSFYNIESKKIDEDCFSDGDSSILLLEEQTDIENEEVFNGDNLKEHFKSVIKSQESYGYQRLKQHTLEFTSIQGLTSLTRGQFRDCQSCGNFSCNLLQ